jgi:hypothetical protein
MILSFDIGIKNLSYCFMTVTSPPEIKEWGVMDLTQKVDRLCHCGKPGKFQRLLDQCEEQDFVYFCNKHKNGTLMDKKFVDLKKVKMTDFVKWGQSVSILEKHSKAEWEEKFSTSLKTNDYIVPMSTINASHMDMIKISRHIQEKFDEKNWKPDIVLIENQISPIASRMKTVQGMVTQYFVKIVPEIHFVSSSNKLKLGNVKKESYKDSKKSGIELCCENLSPEWNEYLTKYKKKDDLTDSFLQGLWFIKNKMK